MPGLLNAAGVERNGLSTFSFGGRVPVHRARPRFSGGGGGWQLWLGGLLALVGGANIAGASFAGYLLPIMLVALGPDPHRPRRHGPGALDAASASAAMRGAA